MSSSPIRIAVIIVFVAVAFFAKGTWIEAAGSETPAEITARVGLSGRPWINLKDGYEAKTSFAGNGLDAFADLRPVSIASADINRDGFPDLVSGYAATGGGAAVIRFGDPESFGPTRTETLDGIKNGVFPKPFLPESLIIRLAEAPDFLATGDFDRDGELDILTATQGSSDIFVFSNVGGDNSFSRVRKLSLAGQITTIGTGRDTTSPYDDLAIGTIGGEGAQVLFYSTTQSIFDAIPAVYNLSSPASSIAVNQLDSKVPTDLAVTTGNGVFVIHGSGEQWRNAIAEKFFQSQIEDLQIVPQSNVVVGDFVPDRDNKMELTVLATDGTIHIKAYGTIDTRPYTAAEMREKRRRMEAMRATGDFGTADYSPWQGAETDSWNMVQSIPLNGVSADSITGGIRLASGNIAASAGEELIIVDPSARKVEVSLNDTDLYSGNLISTMRSAMAIESDDSPIAAVPMRLGVMAQPGLTLLSREKIDPIVMLAAPEATFSVTSSTDVSDTTPDGTNNSGSLREAIQEANGNGGDRQRRCNDDHQYDLHGGGYE